MCNESKVLLAVLTSAASWDVITVLPSMQHAVLALYILHYRTHQCRLHGTHWLRFETSVQ